MNIKSFDKKLFNIKKKINILEIIPTNVIEERDKFFDEIEKGRKYNPQFKYHKYKHNLDKIIDDLNKLEADDSIMGVLLKQRRNELVNMAFLLKHIGSQDVTDYFIKLFGKPDKKLVNEAKKFLHKKIIVSETKKKQFLDTRQIKERIEQAFKKHNINGWKVKEKNIPSIAAVLPSAKTLYLRKKVRLSNDFLNKMIVHEVENHIFRAENGAKQPYKLFSMGFPNYLVTEEGLAIYSEEKLKMNFERRLRNCAARVVAADLMQKKSFYEIYNFFTQYFTPQKSFRLAARAKRGMGDTSKKGGCVKDYIYFKGYLLIKNYLRKGGDLKKLYIGKIGVEHMPLLKEIEGLKL
jgi:uncharacterized protein (TIGR02421 family)